MGCPRRSLKFMLLALERRRIAHPRLRTTPTLTDYIRDLRPAKWGSMINLRCLSALGDCFPLRASSPRTTVTAPRHCGEELRGFGRKFFLTVEIERWGWGCQSVRTGLVSVLGAWLPSLLSGESITTPFGFLGAIAVQSTGHQFRMLLAKTAPFVRVDVCIVRLPASTLL